MEQIYIDIQNLKNNVFSITKQVEKHNIEINKLNEKIIFLENENQALKNIIKANYLNQKIINFK